MSTVTWQAGRVLDVVHLNGGRETVKVLQLSASEFLRLTGALGDEHDQVEIYCSKPKGWAAGLSLGSHNQIMETAQDLNAKAFTGWLRRRVAEQERRQPGSVTKAVQRALESAADPQQPGCT